METIIDTSKFLTPEDVMEEFRKYTAECARKNLPSQPFADWATDEIIRLGTRLGEIEVKNALPTLVTKDMKQEYELRREFEESLNAMQKDMIEKRPRKYWEFYARFLEIKFTTQ
jgi:hypothetical protein